jgi:hypothetical protein
MSWSAEEMAQFIKDERERLVGPGPWESEQLVGALDLDLESIFELTVMLVAGIERNQAGPAMMKALAEGNAAGIEAARMTPSLLCLIFGLMLGRAIQRTGEFLETPTLEKALAGFQQSCSTLVRAWPDGKPDAIDNYPDFLPDFGEFAMAVLDMEVKK